MIKANNMMYEQQPILFQDLQQVFFPVCPTSSVSRCEESVCKVSGIHAASQHISITPQAQCYNGLLTPTEYADHSMAIITYPDMFGLFDPFAQCDGLTTPSPPSSDLSPWSASLSPGVTTQQHRFRTRKAQRLYTCVFCDYSFKRNHDLQRHIRHHTGEKPYSCKTCGKAFARSDYVKRHICSGRGEALN
jgi:uncharacterized C2H2 Zn-finger protein